MAFNQSITFSIVSCDKSGCKFFAKSRFALNRHTAKQHPEPKPKIEEKKLKCSKCDFKSNVSNGGTLENNSHMRKHEDKCGKISLANHVKRNHPKIIRKKSKTFNQCQRCDYTTNHDIRRLRKHEESCSKLDSSQFVTCKHCDFKSSEYAVYHHIIKNHGLSCNDCPFETKSVEELRRHRKTHPRTLQPKKCTIKNCEFKCSQYLLTKHLETAHGIKRIFENFQCKRCDHVTNVKKSLRKHENICLKNENLNKCGIEDCGKKFGTETSLAMHQKRYHPGSNRKKCQRCDYTSNDIGRIRSHWKSCLKVEKLIECEIGQCKKKFGTETALSIHRKREHPELVFHCENCNYKTMKSTLFQYHKKVCGEDTQCPICGLTCQKAAMKKHYLEIHEIGKFECDICSFETKEQSNLSMHIDAIHLGLKKYKCEKCEFKTGWPMSLKAHEKKCGSMNLTVSCNMCNTFKGTKVDLKTHLKTVHLKKEKLKCQRCDHSTTDNGSIKRHWGKCQRSDEIHPCTYCGYRTGTLISLDRHISKLHPDQKSENCLECLKCDYVGKTSGHLKSHLKTCSKTDEIHSCEVCGHRSGTQYGLILHIKSVHPEFKRKHLKCERYVIFF